MSSNLHPTKAPDLNFPPRPLRLSYADNSVVLLVKDCKESQPEIESVLELNGYRVIDTDNGQDAAKRARFLCPDLLLIDLDVPLLYEMVAARQIVKNAQLGFVPVVIVTRERDVDPAALLELGVRRNEYVTRLSDYDQLEQLLDYLLPVAAPIKNYSAPVHRLLRTTQIVTNEAVPHVCYATCYEQSRASTASINDASAYWGKTEGADSRRSRRYARDAPPNSGNERLSGNGRL